jgi:hypothetical protein
MQQRHCPDLLRGATSALLTQRSRAFLRHRTADALASTCKSPVSCPPRREPHHDWPPNGFAAVGLATRRLRLDAAARQTYALLAVLAPHH